MFIITIVFTSTPKIAYAETLNDSINEQINSIDLTELTNIINEIEWLDGFDLSGIINKFLNGEYEIDFSNIFTSLFKILFDNILSLIPPFLIIIIICFFNEYLKRLTSTRFNNSTREIIDIVGYLLILITILILFNKIYKNIKITIENILKFNEIMSPIILTVMLVSGAKTSFNVFQPVVSFISVGINGIINSYILPTIYFLTILYACCGFSKWINLSKIINFLVDILKYVFGIFTTIFTIFISVHGLSASLYDGISIRATKYAISNSVPIIGGFLKDSFDLVTAGSVIIKNVLGISSIFYLFNLLLMPVLSLISISIMLKFTSSILSTINENKISELCFNVSKSINYLLISTLLVSLMFFTTILIIMLTANYCI